MDIKRMRKASLLLPPPGGDVVIECLDEIERLQARINNALTVLDWGSNPDWFGKSLSEQVRHALSTDKGD